MINNEDESSTKMVTKTNSIVENNSNMSSNDISMNNQTGAEQLVQPINDEQKNETNENDQQEIEQQEQQEQQDDEFIRITAAHQILTEAQAYDDQKNYPAALHLYRICVDLLLEELMFTEGTEQSRVYLREKCTAIMDHIDYLKTKLEPLPIPEPVTTTEESQTTVTTTTSTEPPENHESMTSPPTDQLSSLHLS